MIRCLLVTLILSATYMRAEDIPPVVRFIRAYGENNELKPPVVLVEPTPSATSPGKPQPNDPFSGTNNVGSTYVTIEFDIQATSIPNLYAKLIHCSADWTEDENGFVTDVMNRTSLMDWKLYPQRAKYANYRGSMKFPNEQVQVRFSGNWLVKIYDMSSDLPIAETRFFAVEPRARCIVNFMTDFYDPVTPKVSSTAYTVETTVQGDAGSLHDGFLNTVVLYRNHRWFEPMMISNRYESTTNPPSASTNIVGVIYGGKTFRISKIPAQNEYRVLDLTNVAQFPSIGKPVRLPLSDLKRSGNFLMRADDGAMMRGAISDVDDEFVPLEINMDPIPTGESDKDVFLVGSFNNWKPSPSWMMAYDTEQRLYRLRTWIRRGRQDYMYATGTINADNGVVENVSFEEFEGNTASASNTFISFVYLRVQDYGGYDAIVAAGQSSIYGTR